MHADSAAISSTDMKIWGVKPRIGTTGSGGSVLRHVGIFLLAAAFCCCGFAPIPRECAAALGATKGKTITTGYVFVDGKYVKPPYIVERYGNGIRINRVQVTGQLVPWEEFLKTQSAEKLEAEGEETESKSEEIADSSTKETPVAEVKKPEVDASAAALADLFGDGPATVKDDESKSKAEDESKAKVKDAEAKAAEAKAKDEDEVKKPKSTLALKGKFEKNDAVKRMVGRINDLRTRYDRTLRSGGALFFGTHYRAYSVDDSGSAETMVRKLAELQKKHGEVDGFCNAASVYFNQKLAEDLYRNRIDYRALQERLAEVDEERKLMKLLNK